MTHAHASETEAPRLTRAVRRLIALNVAVYFLQLAVVGTDNMQRALGFSWGRLPEASWAVVTVVTYMFVHGGFWPLVLNLYLLFLFGPRLERAWSAGEFTRYYLLCGLGGWFLHVLFAREALLVGATAAVLGVALAYAVRWPDEEMYVLGLVPMRVRWVAALLAAVVLSWGVAAGGSTGGLASLAHAGGMAAGWLLLRSSAGATLDRFRQRVSPLPDVPEEAPRAIPRSLPRSRERGREVDDIVAQSHAALRRRPAPAPPSAARHLSPTDLNAVLDKISQRGLESLTSDERRLLEEMSRELRRKE